MKTIIKFLKVILTFLLAISSALAYIALAALLTGNTQAAELCLFAIIISGIAYALLDLLKHT